MTKKFLIHFLSIGLLYSFVTTFCEEQMNTEEQIDTITTRSINSSIDLYIYTRCPWCSKVIKFLKDNNWLDHVNIIDAGISQNLAELKSLNKNKTQCPCLVDKSAQVVMLESSDIIEYLRKKFTTHN